MEVRAERGMEIAATTVLTKTDKGYLVPSSTGKGLYLVSMSGTKPKCSCPDYLERKEPCKHVFAVEFTVKREQKADGTVTETKSVKVTYGQDWHHYNAAQINEHDHFVALLKRLCAGVPQPEQHMGRKRIPLADALFGATYKVYSTVSGRRFMSDARAAQSNGFMSVAPSFATTARTLENPALTPILKALIEQSAAPLAGVEFDFAADSTGFSTNTYGRWYDAKYGKEKTKQIWIKTHLMCGVKTNIVTAVEAIPHESSDALQLPYLLERTAKTFTVAEVSADKGYSSRANAHAIVNMGAAAYIPFQRHSTGLGTHTVRFDPLWNRLHAFYQFNRAEFLAHYGKRSNVESTMWMLKSKFGGSVRSKLPTSQVNEVLCKVLAHNIVVLIHSMYELGIFPTFETEMASVAGVN